MDARDKRLALNEAMFREINERLESRILVFRGNGEPELTVLCECANPDCTERLALTPAEYEQIRSDSRQFVIVPGHVYVDIEEVVYRTDRYEIVRKTGAAGHIADRTSDDSN